MFFVGPETFESFNLVCLLDAEMCGCGTKLVNGREIATGDWQQRRGAAVTQLRHGQDLHSDGWEFLTTLLQFMSLRFFVSYVTSIICISFKRLFVRFSFDSFVLQRYQLVLLRLQRARAPATPRHTYHPLHCDSTRLCKHTHMCYYCNEISNI